MSWVKYRNKRNGHEGFCRESDFKAARKRTDKLIILERFDQNPNSKSYEEVKEPEAAKEAKENKNNKSKNE